MQRKIIKVILVLCLVVIFADSMNVLAYGYGEEPSRGVLITVVVPSPQREEEPPMPHVYPISVWENREYGRREIIRVYELREHESSSRIRREPFEREGFRFELAEIVRREMPVHSSREHAESISISTQTSDLETVIRLLSPTKEFTSEYGYFGVLTLDVSSIQIESQGTTSSNFTATRTREFPHLSAADTSLVPRTITDGGRTYNLYNVEWRTQSSRAVDYTQLPASFTAVATYTRVGTRVSTIGYTTTAEYRGTISRMGMGRTQYTAYFIGIPIVVPAVSVYIPTAEPIPMPTPAPDIKPEPAPAETVISIEQVHIGGIVIETEREVLVPDEGVILSEKEEVQAADSQLNIMFIGIIAAVIFAVGIVLAYLFGKKGGSIFRFAKKASCAVLCLVLVFGGARSVYASSLPSYGFGRRDAGNVMHFDSRPAEQNAAVHFAQSSSYDYSYGDFIGVLTVERLGRSVNVYAGATMEAMDVGAGHFSFTGINQGNTGLIGHNRGRSNGFFSFVRELHEGDVLTLEAGGIVRSYAVAKLYIIDSTDFAPLMQFADNRLTLITCVEYQRDRRRVAVALEIY